MYQFDFVKDINWWITAPKRNSLFTKTAWIRLKIRIAAYQIRILFYQITPNVEFELFQFSFIQISIIETSFFLPFLFTPECSLCHIINVLTAHKTILNISNEGMQSRKLMVRFKINWKLLQSWVWIWLKQFFHVLLWYYILA